jgi:hypothetical protein
MSGSTSRHGSEWQREVPCQTLFSDYIGVSEKVGIRRKREQVAFGLALGKLVPGLQRAKRTATIEDECGTSLGGTWCYLLPKLQEVRESFERAVVFARYGAPPRTTVASF